MKKLSLLLLISFLSASVKAQMSDWTIQPKYDNIRIADGAPLLLCDSLGSSCIVLMSLEGKRLAVTYDSLHAFNEGYALTTKKGTNSITGFFDANGNYTHIDESHQVQYNRPYFSDGYLVTYSTSNYTYNVLGVDGKSAVGGLYKTIYPFNNGYAVVEKYDDHFKRKDLHYKYLTSNSKAVEFKYEKKVFDYKDVRFLTSVTDEGISYAVIKDKLYSYNVKTGTLLPITANIEDNSPKKQVSLVEQDGGETLFKYKDTLCVAFKNRKSERVYLFLDESLVPIKIRYSENNIVEERYFAKNQKANAEYKSELTPFCDSATSKYGILCNSDTILPAQFKDATICVDNFAVVCTGNGKWGMLNYDKGKTFEFKINDNDPIGFRHRFFKTKIRLLLPSSMTSNKCRLYIDKRSGCDVDQTTKQNADTEGGNWLEFDCRLNIPMDLTDGDPMPIYYPARIVYDGIEYPIYNVMIKAWHRKYISVDIKDSDVNVNKGNISFKINFGNTEDYKFTVKVLLTKNKESHEMIVCNSSQINGDQYLCQIDSLAEGENFIFVYVEEYGCPPQITPFVITYVKPAKESGEEGKMTIEHKDVALPKVPAVKEEQKQENNQEKDKEIILES